ncbi:MAG: DNA translocase FtsK [bacterium]
MGRRRKELTIRSEETSIISGFLFALVALLLLLSAFINAPALDLIRQTVGVLSFLGFVILMNIAFRMFGMRYGLNSISAILGQVLLFFDLSALINLTNISSSGTVSSTGTVGAKLSIVMSDVFSKDVAIVILGGLLFILIPLTLNLSFVSIRETLVWIGGILKKIFEWLGKIFKKDELEIKDDEKVEEESQDLNTMISDLHKENEEEKQERKLEEKKPQVSQVVSKETPNNQLENTGEVKEENKESDQKDKDQKVWEDEQLHGLYNKALKYPDWELPPLDLLDSYKKVKPPVEGIRKNSQIIEQTLQSFGITAKVIDAKVGPTVTQYAVNIALGTKVAKIANLKNDLALALAVKGDIRIEAPIPGTSYVGIECANPVSVTVQVKELMEHLVPIQSNMGLGVVVGKTIDGTASIADIQKMPHLLVAGTTGSGKSVLTNTIITSLLMTKTPDEVRLILIDPKQVEFSDYNGIAHLLTPVITDIDKVLNALKWANAEMERRYTIFRQAKARNLQGYNQMMGFSALPYIVIVIDEMADLMLTLGRELETQIVKLAQKARATGIHLILATQRPSVDVITGLIKANIPGRAGLKVATQIDSRVILDQIGAESLLGRGDLLFMEPDKPKPQRIQAVWISPAEIQRVVEYIKKEIDNNEVGYLDEVTKAQESEEDEAQATANVNTTGSSDNMMVDAVKIVMQAKKGSASLLQRRLSIGYNRAARLLDEMQELGIVTVQDGSKPRDVVMSIAEQYVIENGSKE